jgi:hypothetical protein
MAIDTVVEEVADNLEELSEATRRINTNSVGFFVGGMAVGFAIGFYWGYKFNREKIRAEAFKQSEAEVEMIREIYQQKTVAATPKPSVDEVIEEKGYGRPLPAPVPGLVEPKRAYEPPTITDLGKDRNIGWDYKTELEGRLAGQPYVIHQDEFSNHETGYSQTTYTYYDVDDVLVDEGNGHPLPHADIIVGVDNLKFGHGTDDVDVVFVRNDRLELEMEICRVHDSYEEKVLGIDPDETDEPN